MSSEMWDFASPYEVGTNRKTYEPVCHIYFDKFVSFCRRWVSYALLTQILHLHSITRHCSSPSRLFVKWKKLDLTHNLTVIYFSRTYIRRQEPDDDVFLPSSSSPKCSSLVHIDADGRLYEDHYKIVIENETRSNWESLIPILKREFVNYPKGVKWE